MTTARVKSDTLELLARNERRQELLDVLTDIRERSGQLSKQQVGVILGQWYHPLHYFPYFLSRLVAITPSLEMQTYISKILWQELGEGDPRDAHENIYINTMEGAGFERQVIAHAAPFDDTKALVDGYRESSTDYLHGLGWLYGTEVLDLAMVLTVGELMKRCTGQERVAWVDIHVKQEPDHVESSNETLKPLFTESEQDRIIKSAEESWKLWVNFFKSVARAIA